MEGSRRQIPRVWVALYITVQNRFRGVDFVLGEKGFLIQSIKKAKPEIVLASP